MMHDIFLRHISANRNHLRNIYIVQEGDMERQSGGLYESTTETIVAAIECANIVGMGSNRLRKSKNKLGVKYAGYEEFQIPYSELDRVGIVDIDQENANGNIYESALQRPGTYILYSGSIYRVLNINTLDEQRAVRAYTEKMTQSYPTLNSAFDFEEDTVGEDPGDWDTNEPAGTTIQVVAGKYLQMSNSGNGRRGKCSLNITSVMKYSAIEASFDLRVIAADGVAFFIKFLDSLQSQIITMKLKEKAGVMELHCGGKIAEFALSSWVNLKVVFNQKTLGYSVYLDNSLIKSGTASMARFSYLMYETSIAGEATVQIDNVEVSAVATS